MVHIRLYQLPKVFLPRSDLQVLPSGTADQVQGVMAKQLQALCVPSWEDVLTEVKLPGDRIKGDH